MTEDAKHDPGAASIDRIPPALGSCSGSWRGRGPRVGLRWNWLGATGRPRYCGFGTVGDVAHRVRSAPLHWDAGDTVGNAQRREQR